MNPLKTLACLTLPVLMSLSPLNADTVTVFAAASLSATLKKIGDAYNANNVDKVTFNFTSSNNLARQIKAGAPADIFFSADDANMDDLDKQGLIAKNTRKEFLSNSLIIVVPIDSNFPLMGGAQLADPFFKKIALGQPDSVPAGVYAKAYLQKIGIWDKVSARIVPCDNVRAALAAVESANVDAGIVYKTDSLHSKQVKVAYEIPIEEGPAINYPVAIIAGTKNNLAAKKFLDYLSDPASLQLFQNAGFITKS